MNTITKPSPDCAPRLYHHPHHSSPTLQFFFRLSSWLSSFPSLLLIHDIGWSVENPRPTPLPTYNDRDRLRENVFEWWLQDGERSVDVIRACSIEVVCILLLLVPYKTGHFRWRSESTKFFSRLFRVYRRACVREK